MPNRIEDCVVIGDRAIAALVGPRRSPTNGLPLSVPTWGGETRDTRQCA
jgi:hypothetical protein